MLSARCTIALTLLWLGVATSAISAQDAESPPENVSAPPKIQPFTPKALELQPNCMKVFLEGFNEKFRKQARMAIPNCYTDPQDSDALVKLAKILEERPTEHSNIAKIIKSWSDFRQHCAIKQTAYAEALDDITSYLEGEISLKEASKSSFEGVCLAPDVFTTTCQTIGITTTCSSGGGGLPPSRMVCHTGPYSSTCTYTGG